MSCSECEGQFPALLAKYDRLAEMMCCCGGFISRDGSRFDVLCVVCDTEGWTKEASIEGLKQLIQERGALLEELQLEREWHAATKHSVIATIGGVDYEGNPTSTINFLQRLRILVEAEADRDALRKRVAEVKTEALRGDGVKCPLCGRDVQKPGVCAGCLNQIRLGLEDRKRDKTGINWPKVRIR